MSRRHPSALHDRREPRGLTDAHAPASPRITAGPLSAFDARLNRVAGRQVRQARQPPQLTQKQKIAKAVRRFFFQLFLYAALYLAGAWWIMATYGGPPRY